MIPNLTEIIIMLTAIPAFILITFLPAFIELKKPKDVGPRKISSEILEINLHKAHLLPLTNIEDEQKFDSSLIQTMAKIVAVLPSLEA